MFSGNVDLTANCPLASPRESAQGRSRRGAQGLLVLLYVVALSWCPGYLTACQCDINSWTRIGKYHRSRPCECVITDGSLFSCGFVGPSRSSGKWSTIQRARCIHRRRAHTSCFPRSGVVPRCKRSFPDIRMCSMVSFFMFSKSIG